MPLNLEQAYLDLFFQLQRQQWENYADAAGHDLGEINRAIYTLLDAAGPENPFQGRNAIVWQAIRNRGRVD